MPIKAEIRAEMAKQRSLVERVFFAHGISGRVTNILRLPKKTILSLESGMISRPYEVIDDLASATGKEVSLVLTSIPGKVVVHISR